MSRQEAIQQFRQALKAGQKCYRECVHRGRYPYPQVLEERLRDCAVAGRVDLGVLDINLSLNSLVFPFNSSSLYAIIVSR